MQLILYSSTVSSVVELVTHVITFHWNINIHKNCVEQEVSFKRSQAEIHFFVLNAQTLLISFKGQVHG